MFVCVQMAVCMTAPLTGMNGNGHGNHSPREAEGETVCVSGERGRGTAAQTISTSHPKPPHSSALYKNKGSTHTHTHTRTRQSWHGAVLRRTSWCLGQKRSDGVWLDRGAPVLLLHGHKQQLTKQEDPVGAALIVLDFRCVQAF